MRLQEFRQRLSTMLSRLHWLTGLYLTTALLLTSCSMYGQTVDDSLRSYAVTIVDRGEGVYLGNGLILTAAHVAGANTGAKLSVRFSDNAVLQAGFIKAGNFEQVDLDVLLVDVAELPASQHLALCKLRPWPEDEVVLVTSKGTSRSKIIPPVQLTPDFRRRFPTLIADVETDGKSGSGVFDARNGCLLGILSAKITVRPHGVPKLDEKAVGTYFVPAWKIENFIPSEYRP
jgi:trypsin-like peptidase